MRPFLGGFWFVFGPLLFLGIGMLVLWATGNLKPKPRPTRSPELEGEVRRARDLAEGTKFILGLIALVLGVILIIAVVWMVFSFIGDLPGGSTS